ncbi:S-adenosyl-L-methionine-dependent methyltransferase [Nemania sp. NC0429]|nr:S-adenosyl-L-methionine-dependent methyltransferase [Nemania sp. NC0429]
MAGDAAEINRTIFNEEAASYDEKHRKLNDRLTRELQARLDFIGVDWASDDDDSDDEDERDARERPRREVRLLDYACGTGMMSRALAPYTAQCVGMDISEEMVAAYNRGAENQGLSPDEMRAVLGDLTSESVDDALSSPELFNFDIAVVGGGFHHFEDPELAAKRLVERLRPGGVLLIWDFLPHGPLNLHLHQHHHHNHGHGHGHGRGINAERDEDQATREIFRSVMHHGFSEARMREIFTGAGAGAEFRLEVIGRGFAIGGHGHGHGEDQTPAQQGERWGAEGKDDAGGDKGEGKDKDKDDKEALRRQVFFARGTKRGVERK